MKLDIYVNTAMYGGSNGLINKVIMNTQQGILVLNRTTKYWILNNVYVYDKGFIDGSDYRKQLRLIDCAIPYLLEFRKAKMKL